jgi:hypothetical protein
MVGSTRSRVRKNTVKQPDSPSDDGDGAHTPLEEAAHFNARNNAHNLFEGLERTSSRNDVSRLSEGLEPLHLVGEGSA